MLISQPSPGREIGSVLTGQASPCPCDRAKSFFRVKRTKSGKGQQEEKKCGVSKRMGRRGQRKIAGSHSPGIQVLARANSGMLERDRRRRNSIDSW